MKLHLSNPQKIRILAVFTTAPVGVLACVLFLVYRAEALNTNDGTWKYTALLLCNVAETDVAIIVSCAPGFANFTKAYLGSYSESIVSRDNSGRKLKSYLNGPKTDKELESLRNSYLIHSTIQTCFKARNMSLRSKY
ncbi:hypothetical protein F5Y07DRAFT_350493 [Xylaria sp. FL0933]|nr:hypothetical protein F5Y07DRAFT_350493 [Xylaria sp. FL0933]